VCVHICTVESAGICTRFVLSRGLSRCPCIRVPTELPPTFGASNTTPSRTSMILRFSGARPTELQSAPETQRAWGRRAARAHPEAGGTVPRSCRRGVVALAGSGAGDGGKRRWHAPGPEITAGAHAAAPTPPAPSSGPLACEDRSSGAVGTSKYWNSQTTDTTLVSVDGDNGPRGGTGSALQVAHLACASPETITEVPPGATVTLTQSLGCGRIDLSRNRGQGQVLARE
jgi:hypothetical protein